MPNGLVFSALSWRIWRQSQSRTCHEIIIKTFLIVFRQIYTITYRLFKISTFNAFVKLTKAVTFLFVICQILSPMTNWRSASASPAIRVQQLHSSVLTTVTFILIVITPFTRPHQRSPSPITTAPLLPLMKSDRAVSEPSPSMRFCSCSNSLPTLHPHPHPYSPPNPITPTLTHHCPVASADEVSPRRLWAQPVQEVL